MRFLYTANNLSRKAWMWLGISMLFFSYPVHAQKLSKYYTSSSVSEGTLYYINLEEEFEEAEGKSSLVYDLSILSSNDSCYLNFSFFSPDICRIDSVRISYEVSDKVYPVKKLFIEPGKQWHHRYSIRVPKSALEQMYRDEKSPVFMLYTDKKNFTLQVNAKKWRKTREIGSEIFDLISYNH